MQEYLSVVNEPINLIFFLSVTVYFILLRIDAVWTQWQVFHDDYLRFIEWLDECEREIRQPHTQGAKFSVVKAELSKYEVSRNKSPLVFNIPGI